MAVTNADLASQVSSLIAKWDTYTKQLRDWLAGTPTGGPYGDGRYPLQNSLGQVFYVPCPAAQAASVDGTVGSALAYATAADASADAAALAKAAAEAAQAITLTYRDAAQAAKTLAETARNEAANSEANALVHRNAAEAAAATATSGATTVTEAAAEVEADRIAAEAARVAAEAAAAAAATFNPANFYTKAESDAQYPPASSVWLRGISANGNRALGYSASGDLNLARGFHAVYANGTANRPPTGNGVVWGLSATVGGTDYGVQEQGQNGRRFFRTIFNDVWGGWNEYWHTGNFDLSATGLNSTSSRRITDYDVLATDGSTAQFLSATSAATGTPIAGSTAGIHVPHSGGNAIQLISTVSASMPRLYLRSRSSGTWTTWNEVWHTGNLTPADYVTKAAPVLTGDLSLSKAVGQVVFAPSGNTNAYRLLANTSAADDFGFSIGRHNGSAWSNLLVANNAEVFANRALGAYVGGAGTQQILRTMGWANGTPRWKDVIEADSSLSLYGYNSSGTGADRLLNFISNHQGTKRLLAFGEVVAVSSNALRMVNDAATRGAFWRFDGSNVYLLHTNDNDPYGTWTTLRPFYVNWSTGRVTMGHGVDIYGTTTVTGELRTTGSTGGVHVYDRTTSGASILYRSGDVLRIWNTSYNDRVLFTPQGSTLFYTDGVTPTNIETFSLRTSGAYGGGLALFDGNHRGGIYLTSTARQMHFGLNDGAGASAVTDSMRLGPAATDYTMEVLGAVRSMGGQATLYFQNRNGAQLWAWYCTNNVARLWNGSADVLTVNANGMQIANGPNLTQEAGELRIEGSWRSYYRNTILNANSTAWIKQPRIFVGGSDPGAGAEDGDIWIP